MAQPYGVYGSLVKAFREDATLLALMGGEAERVTFGLRPAAQGPFPTLVLESEPSRSVEYIFEGLKVKQQGLLLRGWAATLDACEAIAQQCEQILESAATWALIQSAAEGVPDGIGVNDNGGEVYAPDQRRTVPATGQHPYKFTWPWMIEVKRALPADRRA